VCDCENRLIQNTERSIWTNTGATPS
jgi:hypothetical protein